jgi:uncharacterized NAD(P)/FAD-binding protein YdhS
MNKLYDIIFVGSGISCTYTLVHLLSHVNNSKQIGYKLKLLIIDKDKEFWTGIPYGNRAGKESLIITPLKDFIPKADSAFFISWLKQNFTGTLRNAEQGGTELLKMWLQKNARAIERDNWENLYIPRYWFGIFIKERINGLLAEAVKKGLIEYDLLNATVCDIRKKDSFYEVITGDAICRCEKVVLSIGSPPEKLFNGSINNMDIKQQPFFIEHIYDKGITAALKLIHSILTDRGNKPKNVLIIGSNASSLELIYNLGNDIMKEINELYVISSSGRFPGRIKKKVSGPVFFPENLTSLKKLNDLTAEQIFASFLHDLELARDRKIDTENTYVPVNSLVMELVNELTPFQQEKFVTTHGQEIGKFYRRAGDDYSDKVKKLQRQRKLKFIKGEFIKVNRSGFQYKNSSEGTMENFVQPIDIIISCSGSNNLAKGPSTSKLINNLIDREICKVNPSGRGFCVNAQFETDKNFYVMGPLLAGNVIGNHKIWHAESCIRIFNLTLDLANQLLKK